MTSPQTPRQWTEADIVDWPKDHPDVKDRRGTTWRWYPERDFYVTDWNEAASWMQLCKNLGPLSEVLPETPEPPREDPVPPEIYAKHQYNTRQMREPDQLEDLCTCGEWVADWLKHHAEEAAKLHAPVPASQSVPAVPESSAGGADSGEGDEDTQATSEAWTLHTAITAGIKRGLADFGAELTGCTAAALTGHVISQLREAGLHPSLPLPDSETEWGWRPDPQMPQGVITAHDEQAARDRASAHHERKLMRREIGPWIEVTS